MKKPKVQFLFLFGLAAAAVGLLLAFSAGSHLHISYSNGSFNFDGRLGAGDSSAATLLFAAAVGALVGAGLLQFSDENSASGPGPGGLGKSFSGGLAEFGGFLRGLRCSNRDVWVGGVCGGLGEQTPLPSWVWRLAFLVAFFAYGVGLAVYLLLWICLPKAPE
jgi:phage shock protein PspC (stress-responsive transcriptional regulator)